MTNKKRSKIIIDIIKDKISVESAIHILDLLLEKLENEEIKKWVFHEINGYSELDEVPEYRKIKADVFGIVRSPQLTINKYNIPLPLEEKEKLCNFDVRFGINRIMQLSLAERENNTHCLYSPIDISYINSVAAINEYTEVTHANREFTVYAYTNILLKLKNKLLNIYKELEKNFGNLDDYYIDLSENNEIGKTIINIIYDNSIKIGNNNQFNKSIVGVKND